MSYFSKVYSAQTVGLSACIISVETDISKKTLQAFSIVGLPDKAVEESRDRVSAAIKNTGFTSPKNTNCKTIMSLAPADLKKEGPLFDLAMAIGFLFADKKIHADMSDKIFLGELSLDGALRPIKGVLVLVKEAKDKGFREVYLPKQNAREAALIDGIKVFGVKTLQDLIAHINEKLTEDNAHIEPKELQAQERTEFSGGERIKTNVDFSDVKGQETAKRGLEIAAVGGHNIAMFGPPGTGKTMLAKAFAGILPELSFEEALEVTAIASVAGAMNSEKILSAPPFRAPHHTSSHTAVVGGGTYPKPGEVTLAHRGVLFLDEFPEFDRRVVESLRQPLEDRNIHISRTNRSETFPANFILIAAMNPCPCGNANTAGKVCRCTPSELARYSRKLSGPIVDRIDIWVEVSSIEHTQLLDKTKSGKTSDELRLRVGNARETQKERFAEIGTDLNSEMSAKDIARFVNLNDDVKKVLNDSAKHLGLSPRAYHRVIKVARTIADIDNSTEIQTGHLIEALQYRPKTT